MSGAIHHIQTTDLIKYPNMVIYKLHMVHHINTTKSIPFIAAGRRYSVSFQLVPLFSRIRICDIDPSPLFRGMIKSDYVAIIINFVYLVPSFARYLDARRF